MTSFSLRVASVLLTLSSCLCLIGCIKMDPPPTSPTVKTISVNWSNDTAIVVGEIVSAGNTDLDEFGVTHSNNTDSYYAARVPADNVDANSRFTVRIPGFGPGIENYFTAYAENMQGDDFGSTLMSIMPPAAPPTPACTPPLNSIQASFTVAGTTYPVTQTFINSTPDGYEVILSCAGGGGFEVNVEFGHTPTNGIYTTFQPDVWGLKYYEAKVTYNNFYYYYIEDGGTIYIEEKAGGSYYITFCDLKADFAGNEMTLTGRVLVN